MSNVVRNTIRVLRGVFLFRAFIAAFIILIFAVRWSLILPPEPHVYSPPLIALSLLPTLVAMVYVFIPGLEKRLGRCYLPIALGLTILAFSLESGLAYLRPGSLVRVTLPSGQEISVFLASTEMILLTLVPCVLAGMAYGLRGAIIASASATLIHLIVGIGVYLSGVPLHGFLLMLPLRLAVLFIFPMITGYLADTWRREHEALLQANRQLRGYAATVENLATSRERVRLAREMHDTLAHSLAALVIQFEAIEELQETDPAAAETQLQKAKQLARDGLAEARRAILDLRSSPVEELGLSVALEQLVTRLSQRNGIQAHWYVEGKPVPLLPVQANALYRIAEEALDNVHRHSGASEVDVLLNYDNGVTLSVRDNGQGFDPQQVDLKSYGLLGVYERAALVEAAVTVDTAPAQGTVLAVHIDEVWEE